jgi:two-component system phosphate regulon sensor histidine kinase PhoR
LKIFGVLSPAGWRAVIRIGAALFGALLIGLVMDRVAFALALVLGAVVAFQLWNLLRIEHWVRLRSIEAPPDISGAWGELVAIISRIHRRKQHHKSQVTGLLREFRRLTAAMPEGAVLLGPENEILWFNPRATAWLGLKRKRDFGSRIENLVRQPAFIEYLHTGRPEKGVTVQDASDPSRWFSFHLVKSAAGERQLLIVRDVSRERRLEDMRKDFVANASHELRSPLTVVSGYLDALAEDEDLDPTWTAPVQEMRRQAERMGAIINDLLELSKLESGESAQEERAVDVAAILSALRNDALSSQAHPTIKLNIESDALLLGVESELHSIASNLVSNALKYTAPAGEIELRWWTDDDGAYLSVRDTGVGIAPEHIPRLTERFYRVDPGRARDVGGSGLGLSIVKHALQRHGGELRVESKEGLGSTFTCEFPAGRIIAREEPNAAIR